MPVPKPKRGEKQDEYVSRTIGFLVGEGMDQEQAAAIAYQQWRDRNKKKVKKTQYEFIKSIPMDMSFNEIRDKIGSAASKTFGNAFVNDIYLDGTCIIEQFEDGVGYKYYRYDYSFNSDDDVVLTNPVEVIKDWEEVDKAKINVKKSLCVLIKDDLKKVAYAPVLVPEEEDLQGDIASAEEIEKAAWDFLMNYRGQLSKVGLMHKKETNDVAIIESFLAPVSFDLGETTIAKGTWVVGIKVKKDSIWKDIQEGKYTGFSIGGRGKRTPIKEAD